MIGWEWEPARPSAVAVAAVAKSSSTNEKRPTVADTMAGSSSWQRPGRYCQLLSMLYSAVITQPMIVTAAIVVSLAASLSLLPRVATQTAVGRADEVGCAARQRHARARARASLSSLAPLPPCLLLLNLQFNQSGFAALRCNFPSPSLRVRSTNTHTTPPPPTQPNGVEPFSPPSNGIEDLRTRRR